MADTSDVETALAAAIDAIVYPAGDGSASVAGPARIYRGQPSAKTLDPDLNAGVAHVTVFAMPGFSRLSGGYLEDGLTIPPPPVTITTTIAGSTVTLGGTPAAGQLVGIGYGTAGWVYALTGADTLSTAAAALAALIPGATVSGSTITLPTTLAITAPTGATGLNILQPRWQVTAFAIVVWAPTPAARDTLASVIDAHLSATRFLTFADQTTGRLLWHSDVADDVPGKEQLWKRCLTYTCQYSTSISTIAAQILFVGGPITAQGVTTKFGHS